MDTTEIDTAPGAELLALQQIARVVSRGDDAESRIQDILRHLAGSPGLVRGRVMLADPSAGEIYVRYAHGLTPAELERGRYRIGEGVSGRVFLTGEAALVANVHDEPGYLARAVARDSLPPEQIAFLAVPIVRDHLPVGVLAAHRLRNHERSAQCDLALMEVIATLIAQILCTDPQARPWAAPMPQEPRSARSLVSPGAADPDSASRDLMARMAAQRHAQGRLHQAADLYLKVAGQYHGSEQALLAKSKLLEIAGYYEGRGATRLAADVLDRLQRALEEGGGGPDGSRGLDSWGDRGGATTDWDSFGDSGGPGGIAARLR